ncbi:MAG: hypothetical protein GWN58_27930 [Anaerolineae bacterium]|nr:hypothetical protein [Anaerolineae bacterium]
MTPKDCLDLANLALEQVERDPTPQAMQRWYDLSCQLEALSHHNIISTLYATQAYLEQNVPEGEANVRGHISLQKTLDAIIVDYEHASHLTELAEEQEGYGEYSPTSTYD